MKAVLPVLVLAFLAASTSIPGAAAGREDSVRGSEPAAPIHTRAELDAYLKATPAGQSPLSLLPAGARKRFLGTLVWGRKGVGGFSLADLQQYLTNGQIRKVLALFDLQAYAGGLQGRAKPLTAAERNAPETALERSFDELFFANAARAHGGAHPGLPATIYRQRLARYQAPAILAGLGDSDLQLLFRAAGLVASSTHAVWSLHDLQLDLAELHRRGLATAADVAGVHKQLVAARRFDEANTLAREYPGAGLARLPPLHVAANVHDGNPTVLVVEPDGKSLLHKPIDMQVPLRIVVVAGCHFSEDAARAIHADPELDRLFHDHAIWLADENESLPDVLQWNREFPGQAMHVAWRNSQWHKLDSWLIPTFYVFRNGNLVGQWSGWPAGTTALQSLREHLAKAGVLP